MSDKRTSNVFLGLSLLLAVFLWGGNNTGTKFIVRSWPPVWTGGSRFLCAGLVLLGLLRWTRFLGARHVITPSLRRRLWWRGGLSLATYIFVFNSALRLTSASHVALYLGAAPVWALLWEGRPRLNLRTAQRFGAAALALTGVLVLFWPALRQSQASWPGEILGLLASMLWTNYGHQCRQLGAELSGAETSAHTMWRAGAMLLPLGVVELFYSGWTWRWDVAGVQVYCILAGGVAAFAIWNNALRRWPTSQVLLFNNLIPLSTMTWAWVCLGEAITPTFWMAMILVAGGVVLGQTNWEKFIAPRAVPPE